MQLSYNMYEDGDIVCSGPARHKGEDEGELLNGTVHHQKTFFKYEMLRTVTKHSTIIITKYT